jgi:hypothetical protein
MYLTKISLLSTYGKLIQLHNKNHVYPSQETLLKLLWRHYHISINRRTLNYHLYDLVSEGFIKRIRRSHRNSYGQIEQLTTAVCLTIKGCRLLFKLGSSWALRHLKKLHHKFGFPEKRPQQHLPDPIVSGKPLSDVFKSDMTDPSYLKKYPHMRKLVESKYGKQPPPSPGTTHSGSTLDPDQK